MHWSTTPFLLIAASTSVVQSLLWWPLYVQKQQWLNSVLPSTTSSQPTPPSGLPAEVSYRTVYDFIVVGGGTAGSAIASRLAEIQQWHVLLIEAGGGKDDKNPSWNLHAQQQRGSCLGAPEQRCEVPAGKGLGGNTRINNMLYVRGSPEDYNHWAKQSNADWSYRSVLPYFLKLENFRKNDSTITRQQRGKGGAIPIAEIREKSPLVQAFISACNRAGLRTADYNAERNQTVGYVQLTRYRTTRITAYDAYIRPVRRLFTNLHIMTSAQVTKVLINTLSRQAMGVQVLVNGKQRTLRATKEVILTAGPIFTPQLLLLSGIGPKAQLDALHIPMHVDLPVGTTMNLRFVSFPLHFETSRTVPLTSQATLEAIAFLSTTKRNNAAIPTHEILFQYEPRGGREYFSLGLIHLQPASKGFVRLNTTNPSQNPVIYTNFLTAPNDMEAILHGIAECLKIVQSEEFAKLGIQHRRLKAVPCDQLSYGTDKYWRCVVRHVGHTADQPYGTCPMGRKENGQSVVSPELRVHGIGNLRVADASIMLPVSNGHSQATVYMIAEKASDLIKSAWNWGNELERRR